MARGFATGGNYYKVTRSYNGATAFSIAFWLYYGSAADGTMAGVWGSSGSNQQWLVSKNSSNQLVIAIVDNSYRILTGGTLSTNSWNHVAVTYKNDDLLRLFVGGTQATTLAIGSGSSFVTRTDTEFGLGNRQDNTQQLSGNMAEFATWTVRLTAAQIASLAKGFAPPKVLKPDCYIPLVRDVSDVANKYAITTVGSPTVENHPRIYK